MIKNLQKYRPKDGEYICERCGQQFPTLDDNGKRIPQKQWLKPAAYLRFGNTVLALIPRICYQCDGKMKREILDLFK